MLVRGITRDVSDFTTSEPGAGKPELASVAAFGAAAILLGPTVLHMLAYWREKPSNAAPSTLVVSFSRFDTAFVLRTLIAFVAGAVPRTTVDLDA